MKVKIKRVYELPQDQDGQRILIDRLWPRGLTKEKARIDLWLKDIAPSTELRKWFNHEPEKWPEFQKRYSKELSNNQTTINELLFKIKKSNVTLVYSAKDELHNDAVLLKSYLEKL